MDDVETLTAEMESIQMGCIPYRANGKGGVVVKTHEKMNVFLLKSVFALGLNPLNSGKEVGAFLYFNGHCSASLTMTIARIVFQLEPKIHRVVWKLLEEETLTQEDSKRGSRGG